MGCPRRLWGAWLGFCATAEPLVVVRPAAGGAGGVSAAGGVREGAVPGWVERVLGSRCSRCVMWPLTAATATASGAITVAAPSAAAAPPPAAPLAALLPAGPAPTAGLKVCGGEGWSLDVGCGVRPGEGGRPPEGRPSTGGPVSGWSGLSGESVWCGPGVFVQGGRRERLRARS